MRARRKATYTDPQGNTLTNDEVWATASVTVPTTHIETPQGQKLDCTWKPAILVFQLPLAVGKTWSSDSTCTTSADGVQATIRQSFQSKVTGKALDKVGTTNVPTWVIEVTFTSTVTTPFGPQNASGTLVRHFASDKGLITYEKAAGKFQDTPYTSERTLQNLAPK